MKINTAFLFFILGIAFTQNANSQTYTNMQWGMNRSATPSNVCIMNGSACLSEIGTANITNSVFTSKNYINNYQAATFGILPTATASQNSSGFAAALTAINAAGGGVLTLGCGSYQVSSTIDNYYSHILISGPQGTNDGFQQGNAGDVPANISPCVKIVPTFAGTVLKHRTPRNGPNQLINVGGGFRDIVVLGNDIATRLLEVDSVNSGTYKLNLYGSIGSDAAYFTSGSWGVDFKDHPDIQNADINLVIREIDKLNQHSTNGVIFSGSSTANFSFNNNVNITAWVWDGDGVVLESADNNEFFIRTFAYGTGKILLAKGATSTFPVGGEFNVIRHLSGSNQSGRIYAQGTDTSGVTRGATNYIDVLDEANGVSDPVAGTGALWSIQNWNARNVAQNVIQDKVSIANVKNNAYDEFKKMTYESLRVWNVNNNHIILSDYANNAWAINIVGSSDTLRIQDTKSGGTIYLGATNLNVGATSTFQYPATFNGDIITNANATLNTATVNNGMTVDGFGIFTSSVKMTSANTGLEMGSKTVANIPYIDFNTSGLSNDYDARIYAQNGSSGNGNGDLVFSANGVSYFSGKIQTNNVLQLKAYTVATLPICDSSVINGMAVVTDANSTTYNSIAAGGGGNRLPVFCNGTNWTLH